MSFENLTAIRNLNNITLALFLLTLECGDILASDFDGNMPVSLFNEAISRKCSPIHGFYNRYGIKLPPFIYEEQQSANPEYSAAFVCERGEHFFLEFVGANSNASCSKQELSLGTVIPGGLAVFPRNLSLKEFREFGTSQSISDRKVLSGYTRFHPLVIDYDGVQLIVYCAGGTWLRMRLD
jgi:hypothetical protein